MVKTIHKVKAPDIYIERMKQALKPSDLNDLCDAADAAIEVGGGFGWLKTPERDVMERYWQGVITVPQRLLIIARLEGVVAGAIQIVCPPSNNEAQRSSVQFVHHFTAPWARGTGVARRLLQEAEAITKDEGFEVVNLDVRATMTAAISLYESEGYELLGVHPHYAKVKGDYVAGHYYYKTLA